MGQKNSDLLNAYSIDNSTFYVLCGYASKICNIKYDKIGIVDLLGFVSLYCKDTFVDISINKRHEAELKSKQMLNRMNGGRRYGKN